MLGAWLACEAHGSSESRTAAVLDGHEVEVIETTRPGAAIRVGSANTVGSRTRSPPPWLVTGTGWPRSCRGLLSSIATRSGTEASSRPALQRDQTLLQLEPDELLLFLSSPSINDRAAHQPAGDSAGTSTTSPTSRKAWRRVTARPAVRRVRHRLADLDRLRHQPRPSLCACAAVSGKLAADPPPKFGGGRLFQVLIQRPEKSLQRLRRPRSSAITAGHGEKPRPAAR